MGLQPAAGYDMILCSLQLMPYWPCRRQRRKFLGRSLLCTWDAGPNSPEGGDSGMRKYECVYVISPTLEEEQVKALVQKFNDLVSQNGELESTEEWGKRKFAYEVQKQKEGYYVLMNFSANPDFPAELERNFKITEGILKYLVVLRK